MSQTARELIFEEAARDKLKAGIEQLAQVAGVTLGPKGRNVGLQASWGTPIITNDGNSIVKEVEVKDQYINMGMSMGKEVAAKMKEQCGDGTTTSIILLRALVQAGVKNITSGTSPIHLKRGMDKAVEEILKEIDKMAKSIKNDKEILSIATVAASGNKEIGEMIASAIKKVSKDGVITIEEGKSTETTVEIVEGMQLDRGYLSAYFCTNAEQMVSEMSHAKILITDKKINSVHELLPILQTIATAGQELLIIADDIEGDALSTLVINKLRGILKVCAIKAPGFGAQRKAILEDIAILTGGILITDDTGTHIKDADASVLGSAEKITVGKEKTVIIGGDKSNKERLDARIKQIETEMATTQSSYEKEKLEERKAKLKGGVAQIRVGAATEPEMKQKKQLFQDSLSSTKAALEGGVVVGGGMALLNAARKLDVSKQDLNWEEKLGFEIAIKACEAPAKQLIQNAGHDALVVLDEILKSGTNFGFNALSEKVEDLFKADITDPAKVVKTALQLSSSTAGIILLSEVLIGDAPEEEKNT